MTFRVRVTSHEFRCAAPGGYVDGEIPKGSQTLFVYVVLGNEGEYRRSQKDRCTDYRIFHNCELDAAETICERDEGLFISGATQVGATVIIYH